MFVVRVCCEQTRKSRSDPPTPLTVRTIAYPGLMRHGARVVKRQTRRAPGYGGHERDCSDPLVTSMGPGARSAKTHVIDARSKQESPDRVNVILDRPREEPLQLAMADRVSEMSNSSYPLLEVTKFCPHCKLLKSGASFGLRRKKCLGRTTVYIQSWCGPCRSADRK